MTDALLFLSTCSDAAEAERIATALVTEQIAACVNILPGVRSIYRWQGAVESATEALLLIKTTIQQAVALEKRIRELHTYQVPELIALPVQSGLEDYLTWLRASVSIGA